MRATLLAILFCLVALPALAADVARGKYLAILGDCAGCHTQPHGPAYAGGLPFNAQFGTVYSTNITPDPETGIGKWSEQDFYRTLHDGIAPGGKHLYPAFPYIYFARITRQDTADLFAYLKTLKPVNKAPTPNRLIFPMNLRFGLIFWNWLYFNPRPPALPATAGSEWRRGEYLVNGLGHCAACHTPKTVLFGDVTARPLAGGVVDNWFAANLTGNKGDGLGVWPHDDVMRFLATGASPQAIAAGSMQEKVASSTSHMTQADLSAIATYLKSLPPRQTMAWEKPRPEQMARGQGVFQAQCARCHAVPGAKRSDYPNLVGDTLVMGHDATTVLRIILTGGAAPPVAGKPPVKPMPAFGHLDDGQVADVATYIRNAWGNSASPVDATAVHGLRHALAANP
jgi:mono/diheme cytochrome c family protein